MADEPAVAETATLDSVRASRTGAAYLLVVEPSSSRVFPLLDPAIVTIGRGSEVELRLDHSSVSRSHARIFVDRGQLRISDLGSHNGTRVNGQQLDGARLLAIGDVVAIGEVILVVHGELGAELPNVILDEATWRRRLTEEVARAVEYRRSLAMLAIENAQPDSIGGALRKIDVIGRSENQDTLVLLPEADPAAANELAQVVSRATPKSRVGVAMCPSDATDADSLIMAAHAAARAAPEGGIGTVADTVERRQLGERTVLLCHPTMIRVFDLLRRLASSLVSVLVVGESGVGKENAAYALHHYSPRRNGPFIALNCGGFTESLVESQLFGHDRGAFTGANTARPGVFEAAHGGTLFLDEIGELPLSMQAKLLRVVENRKVTRLGETRERDVDVRIVAATNRDIEQEVAGGRFRSDLRFRISGAQVHLPPLRDRRCEIPILFRELLAVASSQVERTAPTPSPLVLQLLLSYGWPGNVRELKNLADSLVATVEDNVIEPEDLPEPYQGTRVATTPLHVVRDTPVAMRRLADELEELERLRMTEALVKTSGVKTRAAAMLGMPIRTFNSKFKQYGL
ncbi:MAG: sigma 54-interacting transcriptional regulator [Kofleriaceae bacterium]